MSSPIKQYVIVLDDRSEVMTKKEGKRTNNEQKKEKLKGETHKNNTKLHFGKDNAFAMLELHD